MRDGSADSGTCRRLTRAWISAVSIGASSVTRETGCLPTDSASMRVLIGGRRRRASAARGGAGRWKLTTTVLPVWLPARGMTLTSAPVDGELAGVLHLRALRVPESLSRSMSSFCDRPSLRRISSGRAKTRGSTRSRSPCRRASIIRENVT